MSGINLSLIPAAAPPPGVVANLADPSNTRPETILSVAICLALTVPVVAAQIFTRVHVVKQVFLEDYCLLVALLCFIPWLALLVACPIQGSHLWEVSLAAVEGFKKYENVILVLYQPALLCAKVSILLQLKRVFIVGTRDVCYYLIWVVIVGNIVQAVALFFLYIFQCSPREAIWNLLVAGKCLPIDKMLLWPGIVNVASDVLIILVPLLIIRRLQIGLRSKVTVFAIFGVGLLSLLSSIMRTVYTARFIKSTDPTYAVVPIAYWCAAELAGVILAAAFPTMPRFYQFVTGRDGSAGSSGAYAASSTLRRRKPREQRSRTMDGDLEDLGSVGDVALLSRTKGVEMGKRIEVGVVEV